MGIIGYFLGVLVILGVDLALGLRPKIETPLLAIFKTAYLTWRGLLFTIPVMIIASFIVRNWRDNLSIGLIFGMVDLAWFFTEWLLTDERLARPSSPRK